jgi:hypothetical protein
MKVAQKILSLIIFTAFIILLNNANAQPDSILHFTIYGNIKQLLNNRTDTAVPFAMKLIYKNHDGSNNTLSITAKTRGHFRRLKENCTYPPLELNFKKTPVQNTPFEAYDKVKLVTPCADDEYVVKEWLVYKMYNLITPKSFNTQLVKFTFNDSITNKITGPFYGIIIEEERKMAARNNSIPVEKKINPLQTNRQEYLTMAVFQYLIANTDWGVQYMQNIKLIASDSNAIPTAIPYDFDHAGIVNTPYAKPTAELLLSSIRERRFRGFCVNDFSVYSSTVALYNKAKPAILSLYNNCNFITNQYKKEAVKFIEEFYSIINNLKKLKNEFSYPCDKFGTGNVIIKGLKE